jgi:hypothetical protein
MTDPYCRSGKPKPTIAHSGRKERQAESVDCSSECKVWKPLPTSHLLSKYGQKLPCDGDNAQGERRTRHRSAIGWICKPNKRCHSELSCSLKSCALRCERGRARRFFGHLPKLLDRHPSHPHFPLKELPASPTQFPQSSHAAKDRIREPQRRPTSIHTRQYVGISAISRNWSPATASNPLRDWAFGS